MWQDGSLTDSRSSVGGTSTVTSSAADESVEGEEGGGGGGRGGVVDGGRKRKQKRGDKLLPKKRRVDTAGRVRTSCSDTIDNNQISKLSHLLCRRGKRQKGVRREPRRKKGKSVRSTRRPEKRARRQQPR